MTWLTITPGSGQANSASPTARPPGVLEKSLNMIARAGRWVRRLPVLTLHANPYTDRLVSAWAYKLAPAAGPAVYDLMAATAGDIATGLHAEIVRLLAGSLVPIPKNGVTMPPQNDSWRPLEHSAHGNQKGFACRRSDNSFDGLLLHVTPSQVTRAGIPTPTAAAAVVAGSAGALTGTWNVFAYSWLTDDGYEGNAKVTTGNVVLAADKFSWSGMETPTHPRVTKWRLYRGKVGANNTIAYQMVDIPTSTALPYEEDFADSTLGTRKAPSAYFLPPGNPEHVVLWDDRMFVTTNDAAGPGWHHTTIDSSGPKFEAYDPSTRLLRLAPLGGKRAVCSVPWDIEEAKRLALCTDSNVNIATPTSALDVYAIAELEGSRGHGLLAPGAVAAGMGMLVWYCASGHVHMSDGGPAQIISYDWVEQSLASIPDAYRERVFVAYRLSDGGFFSISIPSTSVSTENDLDLTWSQSHGWNERDRNVDGARGLTFATTIEPGSPKRGGSNPSAIDVGLYAGDNRVCWLDAHGIDDAGLAATGDIPVPVHIKMILPAVPMPQTGEKAVAGAVMFMLEARRDVTPSASVTSPGTGLTVALRLDGLRETTPVPAVRDGASKTLYARAQNLGDPADYIQPIIEGDTKDAIEITFVQVDAESVGMRRSA